MTLKSRSKPSKFKEQQRGQCGRKRKNKEMKPQGNRKRVYC
jgi:hypothetical protein